MIVKVGSTYTFKDGAGFTAMKVEGFLSGYAFGQCAVDSDGEDIVTCEERSIQLNNFIEEIHGVNWENAKNLSEVPRR